MPNTVRPLTEPTSPAKSDPDALLVFQEKLDAEEHLLWAGRPQQGLMLRPSDAYLIPFSLLWGGFAIFWETTVLASGAPFFFTLWGIPFVLMGIYMILGRFFVDAKQREATHYALTNERVIITSGLLNRTTKLLSLRTMAEISLTLKKDGRGTIAFGPSHPMAAWYSGMTWPGMGRYTAAPSFEMIEDAQSVYELVRKAQRAA